MQIYIFLGHTEANMSLIHTLIIKSITHCASSASIMKLIIIENHTKHELKRHFKAYPKQIIAIKKKKK